MNELKASSRALLRQLGQSDGPTPEDRERVKHRLLTTLAATGAATAATTNAAASASTP